jgi:putative acetyltransferase
MHVTLESPDQPDVIALVAELDAYQDTLYPPESRHALELASLKQPNVRFAVARDAETRAVGCGAVLLGPDYGELKRLYVQPRGRGQGVARALMALLEAEARRAGCYLLRLETGPYQPEALSLYTNSGYERCAPFGQYTNDPLSVFMQKRLSTKGAGAAMGSALMALALASMLGFGESTHAQTTAAPAQLASREKTMSTRATGLFEVRMSPAPLGDAGADATLGRMLLDKTFSGDLVGTGKGEMLMAGTAVKGSAGYVAIEHVRGTLGGRTGGFVLQHTGTMNRGEPQLSVTVVPDSGTGELVGLAGTLAIIIKDGKHRYEFDYTLPAQEPR